MPKSWTDRTGSGVSARRAPAAPLILATGEDPILGVADLERRVDEGRVRFFVIPQQPSPQAALVAWLAEHYRVRSVGLWLLEAGGPGGPRVSGPGGLQLLFDCARPEGG